MRFDPQLVHEYLRQSARYFPGKPALIFGEERLSYQQLNDLSEKLAVEMIRHGLRRHDRVILYMDNSPEVIVGMFAVLKAGATFSILHPAIKAPKLNYILEDSGASILITNTVKSRVVSQALKGEMKTLSVIWRGSRNQIPDLDGIPCYSWDDMISGPMDSVELPRIIDADLATLIYTSGSTGEPKGVMSSHLNMVSAARSIISYIGNTSDDVILDTLPLSFDYGLYQVIMSVMCGAILVLEPSFMFPVKILQAIERYGVTGFPIVPTILSFLVRMPSLKKYNLRSLRYMSNTGSALSAAHIEWLQNTLPHVRMYSMYGLTECKRVAYMPPEKLAEFPNSVGIPMPNCEVFVVDEQGKEVPPNVQGELVIRGSNVMRGYWNAEELTAKTFRPGLLPGEKMLYSGDYFKRDENGFLYFQGRKDDMLKTKGERVSPKEIENVIAALKGVQEVAVIGVPDDMLGKAIKAVIVPAIDASITEKEVLRHCSERMEIFMIPKYVQFVETLPRNANGKVDKAVLESELRTAPF